MANKRRYEFIDVTHKGIQTPPNTVTSNKRTKIEKYEVFEVKCIGKFCDHSFYSKRVPKIPKRLTNRSKNYKITLTDLIELGSCYHCKLQTTFHAISLEKLATLAIPLEKLNRMIGMTSIKDNFVEQIIYALLELDVNPQELLHTIIEGPPGTGKTCVVDILAEIYLIIGCLKKNVIKKVKRSDLIAKYLGQTAIQTQQAINEAIGGILVIDEAYSLGSPDKRDSYSKECIDTINRNLTENAGKFICIIIGYSDELDKCFFAYNPGLKSRFRFRFTIDKYTSDELCEIFKLKVSETKKWRLDNRITISELQSFFKNNYDTFVSFGRDVESLLLHTKTTHANRVFLNNNATKAIITLDDVHHGHKRFVLHNTMKPAQLPKTVRHLYN